MNVPVNQSQIAPPNVGPQSGEELIEDKILHLLKIYPKVSPSMLQIGIGSSLPPKIWRPILEGLIKSGQVKEDFVVSPTASGRQQTYCILSLSSASITVA